MHLLHLNSLVHLLDLKLPVSLREFWIKDQNSASIGFLSHQNLSLTYKSGLLSLGSKKLPCRVHWLFRWSHLPLTRVTQVETVSPPTL